MHTNFPACIWKLFLPAVLAWREEWREEVWGKERCCVGVGGWEVATHSHTHTYTSARKWDLPFIALINFSLQLLDLLRPWELSGNFSTRHFLLLYAHCSSKVSFLVLSSKRSFLQIFSFRETEQVKERRKEKVILLESNPLNMKGKCKELAIIYYWLGLHLFLIFIPEK